MGRACFYGLATPHLKWAGPHRPPVFVTNADERSVCDSVASQSRRDAGFTLNPTKERTDQSLYFINLIIKQSPPRPATEARRGSLEPGRPSRALSANTRYPAGRPHTPPAGRMYATDVRQTSDVRQTDVRQHHRLMPHGQGHNKTTHRIKETGTQNLTLINQQNTKQAQQIINSHSFRLYVRSTTRITTGKKGTRGAAHYHSCPSGPHTPPSEQRSCDPC